MNSLETICKKISFETKFLLEKTKHNCLMYMLWLLGELKWINNPYAETYFSYEVEPDVSYLKQNQGLMKYEKEADSHYMYLVEKYKEIYCPSTFYEFFSFENQEKYFWLRVEIEDIISEFL